MDALVIAYFAHQVADHERNIEHLNIALASARRIGAAIGIVMATSKLTEDEAFKVLVRLSQESERKLRDVADDIVQTGAF